MLILQYRGTVALARVLLVGGSCFFLQSHTSGRCAPLQGDGPVGVSAHPAPCSALRNGFTAFGRFNGPGELLFIEQAYLLLRSLDLASGYDFIGRFFAPMVEARAADCTMVQTVIDWAVSGFGLVVDDWRRLSHDSVCSCSAC